MTNEIYPKIIMPILRHIKPMRIASELVSVQPMSLPVGNIFDLNGPWRAATYRVVATHDGLEGKMYHVAVYQLPIAAWLEETFGDEIGEIQDERGQALYVLTSTIFTMLELKYG